MKKYDKAMKAIPFGFQEGDVVQIVRSKEFLGKARELSDCISALPLTKEQNDRLVALMIEQVCITEVSAFKEGVHAARNLIKAEGGVPYVQ